MMKNLVHPLTPLSVLFIFILPRATSTIDCDFEDDEMCGYTYNTIDRHGFMRTAGPPYINCTGLESDHTFSSSKGHYIFTGMNGFNPVSSVVSKTYNPLSKEHCLEVWYYMKSRRLDCELNIFFNEEGLSRRRSRRFAWKGDTNQRWDRARVDVPAETRPFTLEIQAITYYQADALVALDDISIKPWSCSVSSSGPDKVLLDHRPSDVLEHTLLDVLCTCENCLPACAVKWSLNDEMFQKGDRLSFNVSRSTDGIYVCHCINIVSSELKTLGFGLRVRFGPEHAILDPALTQQASQELNLLNVSCNCGSCSPTCYVLWTLDDVHVARGKYLQLNVSRDSVGNYSCTCNNPLTHKMKSTYFELRVNFGPDQAILDPALTRQTIPEHSPLIVFCTCTNCTPACTNMWYLNDVHFGNSSSLWFGNVSRNSAGRYTCICTNPATLMSESKGFELIVNYGPDEVVLTPAVTRYTVEKFSAMRPVSCNCGMCKPSCTGQWMSNTFDVSFKDQCSLELKNVTRHSAGLYICTCVNPYTSKQESRQFNLTVQSKMTTNEGTDISAVTEADAETSGNKELAIIAALGTGAGVCFLFLVVLLAYIVLGRRRRQHVNKDISENRNMDGRGINVKNNGQDNLPLQSLYRLSAGTQIGKLADREPSTDYEN